MSVDGTPTESELLYPRKPILTLAEWEEVIEPALTTLILAGHTRYTASVMLVRCRRCLDEGIDPSIIVYAAHDLTHKAGRIVAAISRVPEKTISEVTSLDLWYCLLHDMILGSRFIVPEDVDVGSVNISRLFRMRRRLNELTIVYQDTLHKEDVGRRIDAIWKRIDHLTLIMGADEVARAKDLAARIAQFGNERGDFDYGKSRTAP